VLTHPPEGHRAENGQGLIVGVGGAEGGQDVGPDDGVALGRRATVPLRRCLRLGGSDAAGLGESDVSDVPGGSGGVSIFEF
jgi:hypothetical protein